MNTNAASGSGRVIQAHQAIAEDIKALGVDTVFGLMSDDTAVFCTALRRSRHRLPRRAA